MGKLNSILKSMMLGAALCSCANEATYNGVINITEEMVQEKTVELKNPQTIKLDIDTTSVSEQAFYLFKDSLVLVQNDGRSSSFADLYSLKTGERVAQLAPNGRGPGEYLSGQLVVPNIDEFYFADQQNFNFIDANAVAENKTLKITHSFPYFQGDLHPYLTVLPLDKENYVGYSLWYVDDPELNTNNIPALVKYKAGVQAQSLGMNEHFPGQVNGATLFTNPQKTQIWMADWHKDIIKICDTALNIVKEITGPYNYTAGKYITMNSNAPFKMLFFPNSDIYKSYGGYTCTKESVYIIYENARAVNYREYEKKPLAPVQIFKFNWSGTLEQVYQLDKHVITISISSNGKHLYCTQQDYFADQIKFIVYSL